MTDHLHTPPHSIDAEVCVLGSMILRPERLQDAMCEVRAEWFYRPAHQTIFQTIAEMGKAGEAVDAVTLRQKLRDLGQYERIGGDAYLRELMSGVPDAMEIGQYAKILRDKYLKRCIISLSGDIAAQGYDSSTTAATCIGDAYEALQSLVGQQDNSRDIGISEAIDSALDRAEGVARGEIPAGLSTGYAQLDSHILSGGFREGELVIIAADTSVGKTVVGGDMARAFCRRGGGAVFATAEMPADELAYRLLAAEANVPINTIRSGRLLPEQSARIAEARKDMRRWRMKLLEGSRTIADIVASAKRMNSKWSGGLSAVVVDYLQIMTPEDLRANRESQVGTMALRCKQAAADMRIPWLVMSQFNRGHQAAKQPPTMANLRDSGQIEQHANIVILLHPTNDRAMLPGTLDEGMGYYEIGLFVPKNRNGMTHASWDEAIIRKLRRFVGRTDV